MRFIRILTDQQFLHQIPSINIYKKIIDSSNLYKTWNKDRKIYFESLIEEIFSRL